MLNRARKELQRDRMTERQIVRAVHLAHAATAQQADDPIAARHHVAGRERRTRRVRRRTAVRYVQALIDAGHLTETSAEHDRRVNLIRLRRNFGQTPALKAGFDFARGAIIISMDGDMQHDPEEIPRFLEKIEEGYDLVSGWRQARHDHWLMRRIPSRAANWRKRW